MKNKFIPPNKTLFTKEELEFIACNYEEHTNRELWLLFNELRTKKCGFTVFRNVCRAMGLQHQPAPFRWNARQINYLVKNYRRLGDTELAVELNKRRKPGQEFNRKNISKKRMALSLRRSPEMIHAIIRGNIRKGRYQIGLQLGRDQFNHLTPAEKFLETSESKYLQL